MPIDHNKEALVHTTIRRAELMIALRSMTVNQENFDHRGWAIWDAEIFERIAKMIREGYAEDFEPTSGNQPDAIR